MKIRTFILILPVLLCMGMGLKAQWEPVRYEMDITVCYETNTMHASCLLTVKNTSDSSAETLPLMLYRLLSVGEVTEDSGHALSFVQQETSIEGIPQWEINAVGITLSEAVQPGGKTMVRLSYGGTIQGYEEIMGYVKDRIDESFTILREDAIAYPGLGEPTLASMQSVMFHAYDYRVTVRVPEHLYVANGGRLVEKTTADGITAFTYENLKPAWRMDFAIGSYNIMESGGFRIFYFSSDEEGAVRVIESAMETLDLYAGWFGPLQGMESFSVIQIPEGFGSQADVTSILQTADAFLPDQASRTGLYHELAHLWHPKENETFPSRWNEGHATFMQYLAAEVLDNRDGLVARASEASARSFVRDCPPGSPCAEVPFVDYGKERMTNHSYTRGMVLFHVLYELIGQESFMSLFRENYLQYHETGQTTGEFIARILDIRHPAMPRFVAEWFYGTEANTYLHAGKSVAEIVGLYTQPE